jgi:hypothetical protein
LSGVATLVVVRAFDDDALVELPPGSKVAVLGPPFSFCLRGPVRGGRELHIIGAGSRRRGEAAEWRSSFVRYVQPSGEVVSGPVQF